MAEIFLAVCFTGLVLNTLFVIRNQLVFKIRMRRLANVRTLTEMEQYDQGTSYLAMTLDLTKWTYKQFFPENN